MPTSIICHGCGTVGAVNRVTAGLRCTCGSNDLDLFEPGSIPFLAAMGVEANSGGTGFGKTMPDPLKGWSDYAGPMPGKSPFAVTPSPMRCPNCNGSGRSLREVCRACKGTGRYHPQMSEVPETQVARHRYPSTQTTVPFVGRRKKAGRTSTDPLGSPEQHIRETTPGYTSQGYSGPDPQTGMYPRFPNTSPHVKTREDRDYSQGMDKPLRLDAAPCPECRHAPTQLVKDGKEDAWWHCPNCGPLANIDKHPEINPFQPTEYSSREKGFKEAARNAQKTGRVLRMFATVREANSGLATREILDIVRRTVQKYSE